MKQTFSYEADSQVHLRVYGTLIHQHYRVDSWQQYLATAEYSWTQRSKGISYEPSNKSFDPVTENSGDFFLSCILPLTGGA